MLEYQLQREDCRTKTRPTVHPHKLNEGTKFKNRDSPTGKLFPPRC